MRVFLISLFVAFGIFFVIPQISHAATPIVQCDGVAGAGRPCQTCDFVKLGKNILDWIIGIMASVSALVIMYAGFLMVTSGGSTEKVSHATHMITNTVIGFIILLSAWLIVDTFMKLMVGDTLPGFGPWNEIQCVSQPTVTPVSTTAGGGVTTGSGAYTGPLSLCSPSNPACSATTLQAAGLNQAQANVMSCIAMTESSGNPSTPPYNVTHPGSNSSACGTFQITQTTWRSSASGGCSSFTNCTNAVCNIQTMVSLVQRNGYRDWTCANCNSRAQACIDRYK